MPGTPPASLQSLRPLARPPRGQGLRLRLGMEPKRPLDADALKSIRRTLVVIAHMDDEINACGLLSRLGGRIDVVVLTDGAANPRTDPAVLGSRTHFECRRDELHASMALLSIVDGLTPRFPDSKLGEHVPAAVDFLAAELEARRPDLVVTFEPSGLNHHPDHRATHAIACRALARSGCPAALAMIALPPPFCWVFGSDFRSAGPVPLRTLRLTDDETRRKVRLVETYRSQASTLRLMMLGLSPRRFFRLFPDEWYIWLEPEAAAAWARAL